MHSSFEIHKVKEFKLLFNQLNSVLSEGIFTLSSIGIVLTMQEKKTINLHIKNEHLHNVVIGDFTKIYVDIGLLWKRLQGASNTDIISFDIHEKKINIIIKGKKNTYIEMVNFLIIKHKSRMINIKDKTHYHIKSGEFTKIFKTLYKLNKQNFGVKIKDQKIFFDSNTQECGGCVRIEKFIYDDDKERSIYDISNLHLNSDEILTFIIDEEFIIKINNDFFELIMSYNKILSSDD